MRHLPAGKGDRPALQQIQAFFPGQRHFSHGSHGRIGRQDIAQRVTGQFFQCRRILDGEYAGLYAHQIRHTGTGSQVLTEITDQRADVGPFGAGHGQGTAVSLPG